MKRTMLLIAAVVLLATGNVSADKEFVFDQKDNFDGIAVTSITIDMTYGDIEIVKSSNQNIDVFYKNTIFADNQTEADDLNKEYKYKAELNGSNLKVTVDQPRHKIHFKGFVERIIEGDFEFEANPMIKVALPDGKAVEILSSSSDIDVAELALDLDIESSSSDITMENTQGNFACDISSGDIIISGHKGTITAEGQSSDIRLTDIEGPTDAKSTSGDINIEKANGSLRTATASGDNRLYDIDGDIDVQSASGDIMVSNANGSINAAAVSGDIRLEGLSSKDAYFEIESVSGDIFMEVSRNFEGEIAARSVSGSVNSDLSDDLQVDSDLTHKSDSRLRGPVGQGKGRLNVTSTSGDITIDRF
jgi:hypothetical protein